jgi:hypothetical protein
MNKSTDPTWSTVNDDGASIWADPAAEFLQGFLSSDADTVWSPELFRWKLGPNNPAGQGYLSLAVVDDKVIATTSITPKRLWLDGNVVVGGEIGDTYTAEQFRSRGAPAELYAGDNDPEAYVNKSVFGRLVSETRRRAESDGLQLIYGTPNQNSMPGYIKRLDFFHFNSTRCKSFVRFRAEGLLQRKPGLRSARFAFIGLDKLFSSMLGAFAGASSIGSKIDTAYPSVDDIDGLWARLKSEFNFTLVRDAAWFRFRYLEHPNAQYQFVTLRRRNQLDGFMIFLRLRDMSGNRVLAVADWLVRPQDKSGFARLLAEGINLFSKDIQSIHLWAVEGTEFAASLPRCGFLKRGEVPVIFASNSMANFLNSKSAVFEISLGASDNI